LHCQPKLNTDSHRNTSVPPPTRMRKPQNSTVSVTRFPGFPVNPTIQGPYPTNRIESKSTAYITRRSPATDPASEASIGPRPQPAKRAHRASMDFPTTLIKAVKGTRDLLPPSTEVWNRVETVARSIFRAYNYHEIRTPILEETQLFARGVGAETDIVTKEMYTFTDRDESSLTLRPENTASVIRAYIEHRLDQRPGVQKLYYIGPCSAASGRRRAATVSSTRSAPKPSAPIPP